MRDNKAYSWSLIEFIKLVNTVESHIYVSSSLLVFILELKNVSISEYSLLRISYMNYVNRKLMSYIVIFHAETNRKCGTPDDPTESVAYTTRNCNRQSFACINFDRYNTNSSFRCLYLFISFICLLKSNWRSNLYNHRIYKDMLIYPTTVV